MPAFRHTLSALSQATSSARFATLLVAGVLAANGQAWAWSLDDVAALAQKNANAAFKPASRQVPPELARMDYDALRDIRFDTDKNLWRVKAPAATTAATGTSTAAAMTPVSASAAGAAPMSAFEANFFHVGAQGESVRIHEITANGVKPIAYDPADFNFGNNKVSPKTWPDMGYGGVRVFNNLNTPTQKDELIVFQGASYFRALGMGQRYGLSARGLAIDTAGGPEEFPRFTDFWLEKPQPGAQRLTVYALMDSERVTGAYRFDVTPGEETVTDVQARIFMRPTTTRGIDKPMTTLGLAPLTSMFFFGENQPRVSDFRPEVHDSDGLMMATGDGEWLWRPLQNPSSPLVTSFAMKNLKGFGLMQRDRDFDRYEDTEARYESRPSAWITPKSDWGPGRVELLQFATPDETHDNVAAYWVPDALPAPGESISLSYQIAWQGKQQQLPPNGWVTQSRRGTGYSKLSAEEQRQRIDFVIDFAGPALDALPDGAAVKAVATAGINGRVVESIAYKNPVNGAWRMSLRVQRLDAAQPVELRAFLQHDNNTLSETWTNLITP
ncbi:MAG: glucan biosynthesis protein [Polaromonas sp.]|jgi:glucans biosynthesis protein|nr:glucan biosynthesis protein [Polaromonas sp.]